MVKCKYSNGSSERMIFRRSAETLACAIVRALLVICVAIALRQLLALGAVPHQKEEHAKHVDVYGNRLPLGAIARLGTTRLRHEAGGYLTFSPDSKLLASGGLDKTVRLWDVRTGKQVHVFRNHSPSCIAFSPDGKMIASGGWKGEVVVWNLRNGNKVSRISGHKDHIMSIAFCPQGRFLASSGRDSTARVWNVASGKQMWKFESHQNWVTSVCFSPDGKSLGTGGDDGTVRLWDLATGKEVRRFQFPSGHSRSMAFSRDGKTLVSAGTGSIPRGPGELNVWEVATGKKLRRIKQQSYWFTVIVSYGGKIAAVDRAGVDGLELLETTSGKKIAELNTRSLISDMGFSRDGKFLATTGPQLAIQIWDLTTKNPIHKLGGHQLGITAVEFAANGKLLATANSEEAFLWNAASGKKVCDLRYNLMRDPLLAASPDGKLVAVGAKEIYVFQTKTGRLVRRFRQDLLSTHCFTFLPDSRSLICGGLHGSFSQWNVATGKKMGQLAPNDRSIFVETIMKSLAVLPDGKSLVTAGLDVRNMQIVCGGWDIATGKGRNMFRPKAYADRFAVSPDGLLAASSGQGSDGTIRIWAMSSGKQVGRVVLPRREGLIYVHCMAFSPDGRTLATGSFWDKTVRLWEVATGRERRGFAGHRGAVAQVRFSSDGKRLVSASADTTALVWDLQSSAYDTPPTLAHTKLKSLWADLAGEDASKAYSAIWTLVGAPKQSVRFLREKVTPAAPVSPRLITRLVAELDSKKFDVRKRASIQLAELGVRAAPALRKALARKPSLESHQRIKQLLQQLEGPPSGDKLRLLRSLEVLEYIASSEAQEVLKMLAKGALGAQATTESKVALDRLAKRLSRPTGRSIP